MPKIKVYKSGSVVIPIEDAKIASAFKCPWTSKVFSTKKNYVTHLRDLRENTIRSVIRNKKRDSTFADLINQFSFEKIIEWIETHPEFLFDEVIKEGRDRWGERRSHLRKDFWVKITYLDVSWSDSVSNSHSCPRGGVTCWSSHEAKDGRPRGYPGFAGRIEFQLSHSLGFGSDVMRQLGINTGTGGGISNHCYGYDVKFFASDWPGLEKTRIFEILKGELPRKFLHGTPKYFKY